MEKGQGGFNNNYRWFNLKRLIRQKGGTKNRFLSLLLE